MGLGWSRLLEQEVEGLLARDEERQRLLEYPREARLGPTGGDKCLCGASVVPLWCLCGAGSEERCGGRQGLRVCRRWRTWLWHSLQRSAHLVASTTFMTIPMTSLSKAA